MLHHVYVKKEYFSRIDYENMRKKQKINLRTKKECNCIESSLLYIYDYKKYRTINTCTNIQLLSIKQKVKYKIAKLNIL